MSRRLLIVAVDAAGPIDREKLIQRLNIAIDWLELMPNCWLLWTSSQSGKWLQRLRKYLPDGAELFICELNPEDHAGLMPAQVWDFIRQKQKKLAATI
jgi:hypothetical protein